MWIAHWASVLPEAVALRSSQGDRTFADLNAQANRLVRLFRARGVGVDDGVALLCPNRPEFAEVYAATQRGGMRLTPVNWHLTADEAAYIVDDCEAKVLVADARFGDVARAVAGSCPRLEVLLATGGEVDGFEPYEQAVGGMDPGDVGDPVQGTTMLYTSGTTGRPKGVWRERSPLQAQTLFRLGEMFGYRSGEDVHLCTGPLYHAAPLVFSLSVPLAAGCGVVLMDGWDAEKTLRLVERWRVTHTHMVPTMFHRLLRLPEKVRCRFDLSSLRHVLHGAAPCPVPVKRRMIEWLGPVVYEYYAATEGLGTWVSSEEWLEKPGTVGRPPTPDHVRILDEDGRDLPPGEVGTVYLKAPPQGRFRYFKDDSKTERTYRDEWFTLGDQGYLDEDGWLFLTDRSAHLIISGGVNIYPAEVEAVLLEHPAVADVGVIGVADEEMGEKVVAVVQPAEGVEADDRLAAELVGFCRERIAHFKCPRLVVFDPDLPRRDNGKIYKEELRRRWRERLAGSGS
ncbi:MAG: long-chain acyl-CoA synthetase [Acidimicrobiales bacterium]|nr:MAG: long-chain acyl-CoA synthetase [Acidimicrobiales bacterium]